MTECESRIQSTIDHIKTAIDVDPWAKDIAVVALRMMMAQEPVEPKIIVVDKGLTWEKYEVPTCGECGTLLGDALFCPQCGRKVKWND